MFFRYQFRNVAYAANWVTSWDVIVAAKAAFENSDAPTFAEKLIDALTAGELAGGDSRGLRSAAVRVMCAIIRLSTCAPISIHSRSSGSPKSTGRRWTPIFKPFLPTSPDNCRTDASLGDPS